jgi:hypothetical protein
MLIDATYGRRTRAVLITDSDHVILSAVQPETVANRLNAQESDQLGAAASDDFEQRQAHSGQDPDSAPYADDEAIERESDADSIADADEDSKNSAINVSDTPRGKKTAGAKNAVGETGKNNSGNRRRRGV